MLHRFRKVRVCRPAHTEPRVCHLRIFLDLVWLLMISLRLNIHLRTAITNHRPSAAILVSTGSATPCTSTASSTASPRLARSAAVSASRASLPPASALRAAPSLAAAPRSRSPATVKCWCRCNGYGRGSACGLNFSWWVRVVAGFVAISSGWVSNDSSCISLKNEVKSPSGVLPTLPRPKILFFFPVFMRGRETRTSRWFSERGVHGKCRELHVLPLWLSLVLGWRRWRVKGSSPKTRWPRGGRRSRNRPPASF